MNTDFGSVLGCYLMSNVKLGPEAKPVENHCSKVCILKTAYYFFMPSRNIDTVFAVISKQILSHVVTGNVCLKFSAR